MVRTCCVFSCTFPTLAYYCVCNTILFELVGLNKEVYMCAVFYFLVVLPNLGMSLKQLHTVIAAVSITDYI
jgi:hypothetical protein